MKPSGVGKQVAKVGKAGPRLKSPKNNSRIITVSKRQGKRCCKGITFVKGLLGFINRRKVVLGNKPTQIKCYGGQTAC